MAADYITNLIAIRDQLAQSLADETAFQMANGPRPTYSMEGKSYSWDEWRRATLAEILETNKLIIAAQTGVVSSRARV